MSIRLQYSISKPTPSHAYNNLCSDMHAYNVHTLPHNNYNPITSHYNYSLLRKYNHYPYTKCYQYQSSSLVNIKSQSGRKFQILEQKEPIGITIICHSCSYNFYIHNPRRLHTIIMYAWMWSWMWRCGPMTRQCRQSNLCACANMYLI